MGIEVVFRLVVNIDFKRRDVIFCFCSNDEVIGWANF